MSKEIAQTVGGKRIAWLLAILAAFAVMATLGTQWRGASAALPSASVTVSQTTSSSAPGAAVAWTATLTFSPSGSVASDGTGTFTLNFDDDLTITGISGTSTGAFDAAAGAGDCTVGAGNVVTCTADNTENFTSGTIIVAATNPLAGGTIDQPTGCSLSEGTTVTCTPAGSSYTVANAVQVTPETATNAMGVSEVFTFGPFPSGYTCASDTDNDGITPECTVADVNVSSGLTVTNVTVNGANVLVTVINSSATSTGGTVSLDVAVDDDGGTTFTSEEATKTYVLAELRHNDGAPLAARDISSNVRGSRHTVCVHPANNFIDTNGDHVVDVFGTGLQIPGLTLSNLVFTNGGGYASTADTDPTVTDVRIFIGDGSSSLGNPNPSTTMGYINATCISWVSLDAGDQTLSIVYVGEDGRNYTVHWDTDADGNGTGVANPSINAALVKEWNRLEDSTLTVGGTSASGNSASTPLITRTVNVTLNPATGLYQFTPISVTDIFRGSHTNSAGQKEGPMSLAGVLWSYTLTGCGAVSGATAGQTYVTYLSSSAWEQSGVTGTPNLTFSAGASAATNCGPGRTARIAITGSEPSPIGSGTGTTVTQIVDFTFTTQVAAKQVFLAWAGQRVILEHDWRIPAGDVDGGNGSSVAPLGTCPFGGEEFPVTYVKGGGPGNFLPSLGASINGSDQATVWVETDDSQTDGSDIVGDANGSCISRVLFESEDQGQVDIEAFVDYSRASQLAGQQIEAQQAQDNVTKHAFVIYYMKINTINVSLATQVSKPTHNSSVLPDWAPGNPWDASKDDADNAAEWNVSKDILVRGRVTGWFTNANPSGRARDDSNPLNVLPADRWVMPNDWPLLAGGPADPADGTDAIGTAEQFRPYYDIMFAPNNARGLALTTPEGSSAAQVATVVAAATNTGAAFAVSSCTSLPAGAAIVIGTTANTVGSCTGGVLTPGTALAAAPAAGTPIFLVTGVPFEGPFSLLDIKGFAAEGKGGAALSNYDPNNIRDTSLGDGDVDMWDAPMPPAPVSVQIRGTGFIKEVIKDEVYYLGTPNSALQVYPNPFYIANIPDSPFIPAIVVGGGYFWDSWGPDGPGGLGQGVYRFWTPAIIGTNSAGVGDNLTSTDTAELALIRGYYGDNTIARDLVVYTDNHGEFMVAANGDFKTDLTACQTNVLAGGKHCKPGDKVGTGTITATVDYPDFRGKHFPVLSNAAKVDWTWGGYKDVTVEKGETDQFKYIVFHAMDRDGFCSPLTSGAVLLHSVLTKEDDKTDFSSLGARYNGDPDENVDFLIDSGEGIIIGQSGGGTINDGKQFATGVTTFSVAENNPATSGILEFPLSPLAAEGQTDECQAWIKVSNSLLGILNVLTIAKDDEGNIGFDRVIDLTNTHSYTLNFRWSLITWVGADAISVNDAIKGTGTSGKNPGGNDISASVTAIYGWDAAAQQWLGFFPSGVNVPGANDLTSLKTGDAYWIAIKGPSSVTWTVASNVN